MFPTRMQSNGFSVHGLVSSVKGHTRGNYDGCIAGGSSRRTASE